MKHFRATQSAAPFVDPASQKSSGGSMTACFGPYSSTAFCHGGAPPYGGFEEAGADCSVYNDKIFFVKLTNQNNFFRQPIISNVINNTVQYM